MEGGGQVLPAGRIPFRDGLLLEVWIQNKLKRNIVVDQPSIILGRGTDFPGPGYYELGDLVRAANKISGEQVEINLLSAGQGPERGAGRLYTLQNIGRRNMYRDIGGGLQLVKPDAPAVVISHGSQFYINNPESTDDLYGLVKLVFKDRLGAREQDASASAGGTEEANR